MGNPVRVESIDALRAFKVALLKFADAANVALADAEGELSRTLSWLETEQSTHWASQIRKRTEMVSRAKEAVRSKTMFKNAAGMKDSAVDEEKALRRAMAMLQEAEQKLAAVKRYRGRLQKEIDLYKGGVQKFAAAVQSDIPVAAAKLDNMVEALQAYVALPTMEGEVQQPSQEPSTQGPVGEADATSESGQ